MKASQGISQRQRFRAEPGRKTIAAPTRTPRTGWIQEGLRALAIGGPDAVRIETLAQALGVTKGGFYWHFDDRQSLLEEMLDAWERVAIDEAIAWVESGGGDARTRLGRLFALASSPEARGLGSIDLAIRDWARREKPVAKRLRRVDNRRMEYMRSLFASFCPDQDEVEVRCLLALSVLGASRFSAADHGPRRRSQVVKLALDRLLD
jgi:AcrR family transcriptional regulator